MWWFKKKNRGDRINVIEENYTPANLPTHGLGLETFVTSDYPMEKTTTLEAAYNEAEERLESVMAATDLHSMGTEGDPYVDNQMLHLWATHASAISEHEKQIIRIRNAIEMRIAELNVSIEAAVKRKEKLEAEIQPLEGLQPHFQIQIFNQSISVGFIVTILAILFDSIVFYSFLQNILIINVFLLIITTLGMALLSDATSCALGVLISRRNEKYTAKPLFYGGCVLLGGLFLASFVLTMLLKLGSMSSSFGTINVAGCFVPKETYTLAEWAITISQGLLPACTGGLSFIFSLGDNYKVTIREKKKKELEQCESELRALRRELSLIKNAPDPGERDALKRAAAEQHMEALRTGLKLRLRKIIIERNADPEFTEKMALSANELVHSQNQTKAALTTVSTNNNISLNKAS